MPRHKRPPGCGFRQEMGHVYGRRIGTLHVPNERIDQALYDALAPLLVGHSPVVIERALTERRWLCDRIRERAGIDPITHAQRAIGRSLYQAPTILAAAYLALVDPHRLQSAWPYPPGELQPILTDLGIRAGEGH